MHQSRTALTALLLLSVVGCQEPTTEEIEGDDADECDDGVDNDQDGTTDCDDSGCAAATACVGDDDDTTGDDDDAIGDDDDSSGDDDDSAGDDDDSAGDDDDSIGDDDDSAAQDGDGDGWSALEDCDDSDPSVHPGAMEQWYDGVDGDCGGENDYDQDRDGYTILGAPTGTADDCDDLLDYVYPDAVEQWYDGVDGDCGGDNDYDQDADGHTATFAPVGFADDCDDLDPATHLGAAEQWYDGVDQACDGSNDYDQDGDGYSVLGAPQGSADDCDDTDLGIGPGLAEQWYDGVDRNCDGLDDFDQDLDGYTILGAATGTGDDCDDGDAAIHPNAVEQWYDGVDGDCDGGSDWDQDGDGYTAISAPDGSADDCEDALAAAYPGAPEVWYDGVDGDCAGDSDYDQDGDGYTIESAPEGSSDDCDDEDDGIQPGAVDHWYDGVDADCEGDNDYDQDGDGHSIIGAPMGVADDCDDTDVLAYPGASETCDGVSNDCDNLHWQESDEDGTVSHITPEGTVTDLTPDFTAGAPGAPHAFSLPGSGTINICPGTYYVSMVKIGDDPLVIQSTSGSDVTVLSGELSERVLEVEDGDLTLDGLTIQQGWSAGEGGGLYASSASSVNLTNCAFVDNIATYNGGGVRSGGPVNADSSTFEGNYTNQYGGAVFAETLVSVDCEFRGNIADAGAAGIYASASLEMTRCNVDANTQSVTIWTSDLVMTDSAVTDNQHDAVYITNNGEVWIENSQFTGNNGTALYVLDGELYISDSFITDNGSPLRLIGGSSATCLFTDIQRNDGPVSVDDYLGSFAAVGVDWGTGPDENNGCDLVLVGGNCWDFWGVVDMNCQLGAC